MILTKFEHEEITIRDFNGNVELLKKLEETCKKINEHFIEEGRGAVFDIFHNKIKLKQFVGTVQFGDNYLEILPKIYSTDTITEGRKTLTKLLSVHIGIDPRIIRNSNINFQTTTFLDIFILFFALEIEKLFQKGLKKKYKRVRENKKVLKGRLILPKQLRKNIFRQDRFFVEYEEYSIDIPENILIKTALSFVSRKASNSQIRRKIRNLLFALDEISISYNIPALLQRIHLDRTMSYYNQAINFARVFLSDSSYTIVNENQREEEINALLFDMNRLFESYVAYILKEKYNLSIQTQKRGTYLAKDHIGDIFELKPDIFLELPDKILILDTKWKKINQNNRQNNYGISSSDMYQMLAYVVRFSQEYGKEVEIYLIYPKYELFERQINFTINACNKNIKISSIPFSIEEDRLLSAEEIFN